jgi:DNA-binding NtrC family response regulator
VILVVEDNICVRSVTAEVLREAGYSVIEAANAAEAVAVFEAGTAIDLVFNITPSMLTFLKSMCWPSAAKDCRVCPSFMPHV